MLVASWLVAVGLAVAQDKVSTGGWASSDPEGVAPAGSTDPGAAGTPPPAGEPAPEGATPPPAGATPPPAGGAAAAEGGPGAGQKGIVARVESAPLKSTDAVRVLLVPEGGEAVELPVKDDGRPPDVSAGDGTWSGSLWTAGDRFALALSVNGTRHEGPTVEWPAEAEKRDVIVTFDGTTVGAEAVVSDVRAAQPSAPPKGPDGLDAPAPDAGGAGGAAPGGAPFPRTSEDATVWVGLFLGATVLALVAWAWVRRPSAPGVLPRAVVRMPEPGLAGTHTPSVSDGLSVWVVDEADLNAALATLLATLARDHRVLVAVPPAQVVPLVRHGPVFRTPVAKAARLGEVVDGLVDQPGAPLVVLILAAGLEAGAVRGYPEALPEGMGGVVLVTAPVETGLQTVRLQRAEGGWRLVTHETTLELVERDGILGRA